MSTLFIKHRCNRIADLEGVEPAWGVEIDLRSRVDHPGKIHLSHDPWSPGEDFAAWVERFVELGIRGPIILNTKEDGLEKEITECLRGFGVENHFFLDTALPTLVKNTLLQGETKFAIRFSHYEPLEAIEVFRGRAAWAWVDCFEGVPLDPELVRRLKPDFKICLVSPELHGFAERLPQFAALHPLADAVCTKAPEAWKRTFQLA